MNRLTFIVILGLMGLISCTTLPFPNISVVAFEEAHFISAYQWGLQSDLGYDRIGLLRLQIYDKTSLFKTSGRLLSLSATNTGRKSSAYKPGALNVQKVGADIDLESAPWIDHQLDVVSPFQSSVGLIDLEFITLLPFDASGATVKFGQALHIELGMSFTLEPGAINYLGRIHVIIWPSGEPLSSAMVQPNWKPFRTQREEEVVCTVYIEQDAASLEEDLAAFYSKRPGVSVPDGMKNKLLSIVSSTSYK
jgi:hypothetical protein